eukprot:TRINITY_DN33640_c0_g1_i1.p3 TRINITY_DN33640_c0_g1~~TRINITY_DN33640_c0_g1_i1.p3  ORF type:complete len:188 (+),score=36.69 TRINITY_DN33640_c0_g1_i1:96-659(+)
MAVFDLLVEFSFYLFLAFFALCLACGFYYLAEFAEEYIIQTRTGLRITSYAVFVTYLGLWLVDGYPLIPCLVGLLSHAAYFMLLPNFPFVYSRDPFLWASVAGFVLSHVLWYFHFLYEDILAQPTYRVLVGFFFLCIWAVPFTLIITVSVESTKRFHAARDATEYGKRASGSRITDYIGALLGKSNS